MNSNPDPTLEYFISNVVANGWLSIEDGEHLIYWLKDKISLSALVFRKKVHNQLILYLQVQKRNLSSRISKLKESWNFLIWRRFSIFFTHINCINVVTSWRRWWSNYLGVSKRWRISTTSMERMSSTLRTTRLDGYHPFGLKNTPNQWNQECECRGTYREE